MSNKGVCADRLAACTSMEVLLGLDDFDFGVGLALCGMRAGGSVTPYGVERASLRWSSTSATSST